MDLPQSNFLDLFNLMLHRAVAEKLRRDAKPVLQIAQNNLNRWLKKNENFALLEWQEILETHASEEICKIISQDTDEGQRLFRQTHQTFGNQTRFYVFCIGGQNSGNCLILVFDNNFIATFGFFEIRN